jgi:hypothetical protein
MIKWGSLQKEAKPEIPVRKEVKAMTTTPSPGFAKLFIYFLSVLTSNSLVFSKQFISRIFAFLVKFH